MERLSPLPSNMHGLNDAIRRNTRCEGYGTQTKTVMACPFCGAPGLMEMRCTEALEGYPVVTQPHMCKRCERSMRFIIKRTSSLQVQAEMVQCGGPDQPEWFKQKSEFRYVCNAAAVVCPLDTGLGSIIFCDQTLCKCLTCGRRFCQVHDVADPAHVKCPSCGGEDRL